MSFFVGIQYRNAIDLGVFIFYMTFLLILLGFFFFFGGGNNYFNLSGYTITLPTNNGIVKIFFSNIVNPFFFWPKLVMAIVGILVVVVCVCVFCSVTFLYSMCEGVFPQ